MLSFSNPILPGFYPDPSVCRVGEWFYLVNSTFEYVPGLPVHRSRDLVEWEYLGSVITSTEQLDLAAAGDSRGLFAPTIRHHEGVFYVVCTNVGEGPGTGNFVVTSTDPASGWGSPVFVDARGIDPSLFFHEGRIWWTGTREADQPEYPGQTEVWLRELDPTALQLIGPEHILWTGAVRGAIWAEGPHLFERDGWFYLSAAEGGTGFDHAQSIARSREVTGPYTGSARNPILTHRHLGGRAEVQNVGHVDFIEHPDGTWWALALGVRPLDGHHLLGRETFLMPVEWEDGWPVVNPGSGIVPRSMGDARAPEPVARPSDDFRDSGPLEPGVWLDVRGSREGVRSTQRGLHLSGANGEAFVGRRLQHWQADIALAIEPDRGAAGLRIRQNGSTRADLEVAAVDGGTRIRLLRCTPEGTTVVGERMAASGDVVLGLAVRGLRIEARLEDAAGRSVIGEVDAEYLSSESAGGFVGVVVGAYAEPGATAHVPWFDYREVDGDRIRNGPAPRSDGVPPDEFGR